MHFAAVEVMGGSAAMFGPDQDAQIMGMYTEALGVDTVTPCTDTTEEADHNIDSPHAEALVIWNDR